MVEKTQEDAEEDDQYVSEEDDDFAPGEDNASSNSESEAEDATNAKATSKVKKSKAKDTVLVQEPAIDKDEVEGLMQDAGKKKRKRKGEDGNDYDSGGEGGYVKTRSMAAAHQDEKKKTLATDAGATIDVDALWSRMNTTSLAPERKIPPTEHSSPSKPSAVLVEATDASGELVTVTQTYKFAGETHTTTTQVTKDSALARKQVEEPSGTPTLEQKLGPNGKPLLRPLRRISPFDPNPTGFVKNLPDPDNPTKNRIDSKNKNKGPKHKYLIPKVKQPKKLNVVDKSKLDWGAYVEAAGERDELDAAQKARGNYLERQDFLDRVGGRADQALAAAKTK